VTPRSIRRPALAPTSLRPAADAFTRASLADVRREIALAWLGAAAPVDRVGRIVLRPHQSAAVARLRHPLAELGGALLADEVGLGKTFVALALAREAERPLVVAPAALRPMWTQAMHDAGVVAPFVSIEQLSRADAVGSAGSVGRAAAPPDLVIVDEAHHLRNPATRRYARLSALTTGARVLLVSATPVHNRPDDLVALLALFLGGRAAALSPALLGRLVVRRAGQDVELDARASPGAPPPLAQPAVEPAVWLRLPPDPDVLAALRSLPPALPPSDGDDGATLVAWTLARAWASSDGALRTMLRRRLARAAALLASLEAGRHPTRRELRTWTFADDALQLGFPELLAATSAGDDRQLLPTVRAHEAGLRRVLTVLAARPSRDVERAALLHRVRAEHPAASVVAFSQVAATIEALYRHLAASPHVAMLTARGAVTAGGRLSRREVLDRFAPHASGVPPPRAADRVELLLTTDLLSEGVNLQDAAVVVHLDLPWTSARLAQRLGRVARLGSRHARVHVYGLAPSVDAERWLRTVERLHAKSALARRIIGAPDGPDTLPRSAGTASALDASDAVPVHAQALARTLARWCRDVRPGDDASGPDGSRPHVAARMLDGVPQPRVVAVRSAASGFLAVLSGRGTSTLLASVGGGLLSPDVAVLARAADLAEGPAVPVDPAALRLAVDAIARWSADAAVSRTAGLDPELLLVDRPVGADHAREPRGRRVAGRRVAAIVRGAPPHRRPLLAALADRARAALALPGGAGLDRAIDALAACTDLPDERWLAALADLAVHARSAPPSSDDAQQSVVILLLQCESDR
jgi:hypothetical protein